MKYIAVVISGALAGLGGVFLVFIAGIYRENQTNGRGFIGLAALIFGNWRPGGLAAGRRPVRLRRRPAAAQPVGGRARCCCSWRCCSRCWPSCRRCAGKLLRSAIAGVVAVGRAGRLPDHRRPAAGHRLVHPAPDHAARALAGLAATADAAGRRPGLPTRRGLSVHGRLGRPAGRGPGGDDARLRAVLALPGRRRRPGRRRPAWSPAATSRTPPTGWACAPSAGWSATWRAPAAGGWSPSPASVATGSR